MAIQKYVERGRYILGGLLPEGFEVYDVTSPRVRHRRPGDNPAEWACIRCNRLIEGGDTFRRIVSRRAGTSWTDREFWKIHNTCFMGKNVRGFA